MQQLFNTRNYSVRDFEEWSERDELVLAPKFQRREVWSDKARSYLIDTIVRGKPIPKIYMRQDLNPDTRRTVREVVDGQQRLTTVLRFIKDGFKLSKTHHEEYGGKYFSGLSPETQRDILKYEFVVDLLQDMQDAEVYDVFARINTYSEKLKPQELRNAQWFGEFKSCVYLLAREFVSFMENAKMFTEKNILRNRFAYPPSRRFAADWINEGREYASWGTVSAVSSRAERFFREGKPFSIVLRANQSILDETSTIRNAVAHLSPNATEKFEKLVRSRLGSLPPDITIGAFLATVVPTITPPVSFFELYVKKIEQAAMGIIPS